MVFISHTEKVSLSAGSVDHGELNRRLEARGQLKPMCGASQQGLEQSDEKCRGF